MIYQRKKMLQFCIVMARNESSLQIYEPRKGVIKSFYDFRN